MVFSAMRKDIEGYSSTDMYVLCITKPPIKQLTSEVVIYTTCMPRYYETRN